MYTIVVSKRCRKQIKKLSKGDSVLFAKLERTIESLSSGESFPLSQKDHKLTGRLHEFRECHISPDWLLIYRQHKKILILELLATGTHRTVFE